MTKIMHEIVLNADIDEITAGRRLDQALALVFPEHSRSRLKEFIEKQQVQVNGEFKRPRDKVQEGDKIKIVAMIEMAQAWTGEAIELDILYEDDHLIVLNKPANLVVHPAVGNREGTLTNALLYRYPDLNHIPRAGIVHRLDKDTTGLMVVAKSLIAQTSLVNQLQARTVKRVYEAVVHGAVLSGASINAPIGRHPHERVKMAVIASGKPAVTHYRVLKRFKAHTHLKVQLETGRTHQIRVHMAHVYHPLIGDKTYGGRLRLPPQSTETLRECLRTFPRQALHARSLSLTHPSTGEEMSWEVPIPEDMKSLLAVLQDF